MSAQMVRIYVRNDMSYYAVCVCVCVCVCVQSQENNMQNDIVDSIWYYKHCRYEWEQHGDLGFSCLSAISQLNRAQKSNQLFNGLDFRNIFQIHILRDFKNINDEL